MLQALVHTPGRLGKRIALAAAIFAVTLGVFGPAPTTSDAHVGTPGTLCGSVDLPPIATYAGQNNFAGRHWHYWQLPGSVHAEDCGPAQ